MKKIILLLIALATFAVASHAQSGPGTAPYGVNLEPLCWHTLGGVDSTIYVAWLNSSGNTKPTRLYYTNARAQIVTVPSGTLNPGPCSSAQGDSLVTQLDIIINLLGGPDTCVVLNQQTTQTLTSASATYAANGYNSISVLNVSGTVTVQTGSDTATNLPANTAIDVTAERCRYLAKSVAVNASSGVALVVYIK